MNLKPMTREEDTYGYYQCKEKGEATGFIGSVRVFLGKNYDDFSSTWTSALDYFFDFAGPYSIFSKIKKQDEFYKILDKLNARQDDLENQEFRDELYQVINELRKEGNLFYNQSALFNYCFEHTEAQRDRKRFGFRTETDKRVYLIVCEPFETWGHNVCYCYKKSLFDDYINEPIRKIVFLKDKYKDNPKISIKMWTMDGIEGWTSEGILVDGNHVLIDEKIYPLFELRKEFNSMGIEVGNIYPFSPNL